MVSQFFVRIEEYFPGKSLQIYNNQCHRATDQMLVIGKCWWHSLGLTDPTPQPQEWELRYFNHRLSKLNLTQSHKYKLTHKALTDHLTCDPLAQSVRTNPWGPPEIGVPGPMNLLKVPITTPLVRVYKGRYKSIYSIATFPMTPAAVVTISCLA